MRVVFDLGSNLERELSLAKAIDLISKRFVIRKSSSIYESSPVGIKEQPDYLNMALEVESKAKVTDIRASCRGIEDALGRDRSAPKYGPRLIDIDILLYDSLVDLDLKIPHPQTASELFVVQPLSELYPEGKHPTLGISWPELRDRLLRGHSLESAGIKLYGAVTLLPLTKSPADYFKDH